MLQPHCTFDWFMAASDQPLAMVRIGAAAFEGVDRHDLSTPTAARCRVIPVEDKQVELIMADRSFR
jgi:hypothetical protein